VSEIVTGGKHEWIDVPIARYHLSRPELYSASLVLLLRKAPVVNHTSGTE